MIEAPAEVPESQADGKIKTTYDDIKQTLRLPYVPDLMRALAVYPHYFELAWMALKPNAQTVFFERHSDILRRTAANLTSRFPHPQNAEPSLAPALTTLWYAAPKELLATAALRSATSGQQPPLRALGAEDKRQVPPGAPPEAVVPPQASDTLSDDQQSVLEEMRAAANGRLGPEYALLASAPDALAPGWKAVKALSQDLEYRRLQRVIAATVEEAITALPYRMDISTHVLRHAGLSETEIDAVRSLLDQFDRSGRQTLLSLAVLSGSNGTSPFPPPEV
jgi:hypothetical protein